jgi:anti-anti-sigma regulatory factor
MLKLEGRLLGPWVGVLREVARHAGKDGARVVLDLTQVTQVSHEGAEALCRLKDDGVELVGCSQLVESMCGAHRGASA